MRTCRNLWAAIAVAVLATACATAGAGPPSPKAPKNAIRLFDGKDASAWTMRNGGGECKWIIDNGELQVNVGTGDILTKRKFKDYQLHVEFKIPLMPEAHSQGRGNSGVYNHGLYEIQVLDSFNNDTYAKGGCGAIYGQKDPDKNMAKPPEQWQTYDITFHAPRFDAAGKVTANPRITVYWNGVMVHNNVAITGPTTASLGGPMTPEGPIMLQDHGAKVRYRNVWIVAR
jgi:hypothetical protein